MSTSKRAFLAMLGLAVFLVLAAAALTSFGLEKLQKKGDELSALKTKQEVLKVRQNDLNAAKQDIKTYAALEKISKAIVPQEKDQARTVLEIVRIGQEAGIPLESIEFPSSDLGALKSKSKSKKSTKSKTRADPNTTQLIEVPGTSDLYVMEISIKSANQEPVGYNQLLTFLERLEKNRRTAHVTNISIDPSAKNRNLVTFTITLNVYIKP